MGVGAGRYMYDVVVKKFMFAISSPDEFLYFDANINLVSYSHTDSNRVIKVVQKKVNLFRSLSTNTNRLQSKVVATLNSLH